MRKYRITESRLRAMIREAVKNTLTEVEDDTHWPGDINPKATEGFRKDSIESQIEKMRVTIDEYAEEIRKAANSGNSHQVDYYAKHLKTIANLINDNALEKQG